MLGMGRISPELLHQSDYISLTTLLIESERVNMGGIYSLDMGEIEILIMSGAFIIEIRPINGNLAIILENLLLVTLREERRIPFKTYPGHSRVVI